jgi:hypothetical protein
VQPFLSNIELVCSESGTGKREWRRREEEKDAWGKKKINFIII